MRKKSPTLVCRLSTSLTTKTSEHVVPAYDLPRGRAVDRGKVAEAAQTIAQAEAPHAAQPAEAAQAHADDRDSRDPNGAVMSELLLPVAVVMAFGAFFFGCGLLTAFLVTRNQWRNEMIKRGVAHYDSKTGKWEWKESPRVSRY